MFHPWLKLLLCFLALSCVFTALADEVIPPAPKEFFNDYAHVTSPATATRLNNTLREFERQTSSQIWVVIYPTMQSDSSIEDYTVRVYRAWKVGLKGKDNGAVLFVFMKEHKLRIATGYGLEGALPDITCKQIIDMVIAPHFKRGDFDGGLSAGVMAMTSAAKGEFKGTRRTVADNARQGFGPSSAVGAFVILVLIGLCVFVPIFLAIIFGRRRSYGGVGGGGSGWWIAANVLSSLAESSRGGGWTSGGGDSGGGWSGGGGGGDSGAMGGGGSTGGGGASGSW